MLLRNLTLATWVPSHGFEISFGRMKTIFPACRSYLHCRPAPSSSSVFPFAFIEMVPLYSNLMDGKIVLDIPVFVSNAGAAFALNMAVFPADRQDVSLPGPICCCCHGLVDTSFPLSRRFSNLSVHVQQQGSCTMRFGSTAKVLLKCKLKYYRISECHVPCKGMKSTVYIAGCFENGCSVSSVALASCCPFKPHPQPPHPTPRAPP